MATGNIADVGSNCSPIFNPKSRKPNVKQFRSCIAALLLPLVIFATAFAQPPAKVFKRGLNPLTPAQKALRAQGAWWKATATYPAQWSIISPKNSMFLNDTDGDCVLAGECVNINAHWFLVTGQPVIVPDAEVQTYGSKHGILNGADLLQVVGMMSVTNSDGLTYSSGTANTMYCDGVGSAVNQQDRASICSACYSCSGSLKMGVAGNDLSRINAGNSNGWYLGSCQSTNIDHNVEMLGYGTAAYCFGVLNVPIPAGVDPNQFCYLVNTWSTIGVVNAAVVETSGWCNEIDMRTPTSIALTSVGPPVNPPPPPPHTPTRRGLAIASALAEMYQTGDDADRAEVESFLSQGKTLANKLAAKHGKPALAP
jgi:hypothetical protein